MERSAELRAVEAELPNAFEAARRGSVEHLGALVAGLRDYLLLVANRELAAELRAKVSPSDVLQETFLIAQRKIASFEGKSDAELLAWLRAILLNKIQTVQQKFLGVQARDVRREVLIDLLSSSQNGLPDDIDSPSRCAMAAERSATIDEILSHLPCEYEKVLRLRYWEQLSLEEIAQRMNRSTDAVQKLWFRAVERMKRELNRDERP